MDRKWRGDEESESRARKQRARARVQRARKRERREREGRVRERREREALNHFFAESISKSSRQTNRITLLRNRI